MTLNWRGDGESWAEARASHEIGGKYRIDQTDGKPCYGHRSPIVFDVRWYEPDNSGNTPWCGVGRTMEEAKALAEQAHARARSAISLLLKEARAVAREAHKKAPGATEEYRRQQAEALKRILAPEELGP
jgi:hypothetical protein